MTQRNPDAKVTKYEFTDKTVKPHRQHPFLRHITLVKSKEGYELIVKPRFDPVFAASRHLKSMEYDQFIQRFSRVVIMGPLRIDASVDTHIDSHSSEEKKNENRVVYKLSNTASSRVAQILIKSLLSQLQLADMITDTQALRVCDTFEIHHSDYHKMVALMGMGKEHQFGAGRGRGGGVAR